MDATTKSICGRFVFGVCLLSIFLSPIASAQVTTGTISGVVTDPSGAIMAGVKVRATNLETGIVREMATDAAGRYRITQLGLGQYTVQAEMAGFQTKLRSGIVLTVGREAVVDLQLQVGSVSEKVEVVGEAPLVQTEDSTGCLPGERKHHA